MAGQPWDSDPFQLKEEDGRLIARGSADMKGFLACTLEALGRINAADLIRRWCSSGPTTKRWAAWAPHAW